jgi:choline dehydrogenase-like flavoprotein
VLASRLSEDTNVTVLLIEAGDKYVPCAYRLIYPANIAVSHEKEFLTQIPLAWPKILKSPIDWDYKSVCVCPMCDPSLSTEVLIDLKDATAGWKSHA